MDSRWLDYRDESNKKRKYYPIDDGLRLFLRNSRRSSDIVDIML